MNSLMEWFQNSEIWASVDAVFTIVSIFVTVGTLFMVVINYLANKRQIKMRLQKIPIIFNVEGEKYQLKLDIPRKELSRGEVQGILSNYSTDSTKRYNIKYLAQTDYLKHIYEIQSNERDELEIELLKKELEGYSVETKNKEGKKVLEEYVGFNKEKMTKI